MTGRMVIMLLLLSIVGCASTPSVSSSEVPSYELDVMILSGPDAVRSQPVERLVGQLVVLPDGSLLHAEPGEVQRGRRPAMVRRLTRGQLADLWRQLEASGLADHAAHSAPTNVDLLEPQRDAVVYAITVSTPTRSWQSIRSDQEIPPDVRSMVNHLARMAWLAESENSRTIAMPRRYDFGPDPYARYRGR